MATLTPLSPLRGVGRRQAIVSGPVGPPIAGAILWLDAATPTTVGYANGASMPTWPDNSGTGNTLTSIGANQPVYHTGIQNSLGGVLFGGGTWPPSAVCCLKKTFTLNQPFTYFVACKSSAPAGAEYLIDGGSVNTCICYVQNLGNTEIYSGAFLPYTAASQGTTSVVLTGVFSGVNSYIGLAATTLTSGEAGPGDVGSANPGGISIGSGGDGTTGPFGGYVFEFLLYSSALSSGNRLSTVSYLRTKWGI